MPTMRDSDDLTDIPSIVPTRDDVASHNQSRRGQSREIVRPSYELARQKVSTWPVRIMLTILTLGFIGAGAGAYLFYTDYQAALRQTTRQLDEIQRRLALVDEEGTQEVVSIQETLNFHFSEIDKLWAARNTLRQEATDIRSELARLVLVNEGQDEAVASMARQLENNSGRINAADTRINTVSNELNELSTSIDEMGTSLQRLSALRAELQSVQDALNSGDSTLLGLVGRLEFLEQSMESVNAHRLQINETLFRLQENLETLQRQAAPAGL